MMTFSRRSTDLPAIAVIDIGSNSVRLVVFDGAYRAPNPMFNEKVMCGLGKGLALSKRLNEAGVARAKAILPRYVRLARDMAVAELHVTASAAIREAENGAEFVSDIEKLCGVTVMVLSGEEEAHYASQGVLSGNPFASGIVGDLGGGSLEFMPVGRQEGGQAITLPLGPLRLAEMSVEEACNFIDKTLTDIPWFPGIAGQEGEFHAVGGAWRAIASMHIHQTGHPIHILHEYTVSSPDIAEICAVISRLGPKSLTDIEGVSKERIATLPLAAEVLHRVLEIGGFSRVVFSANGIREGLVYDRLDREMKMEDPLLCYCRRLAIKERRFDLFGEEIFHWIDPVFDDSHRLRRLRMAACWLGDVAWRAHPDHRAEAAFFFILHGAFSGITHEERVLIGLALSYRYSKKPPAALKKYLVLLSDEERLYAQRLGLALRLAHALSGGLADNLAQGKLCVEGEAVILNGNSSGLEDFGENVEKRLARLASLLGRQYQIAWF